MLYADQVLEHMSGIDAARSSSPKRWCILGPGGVLFVVVPDYLKERTFFWDVDYTHNFVTTERRVRQLFYDGGFNIERVVRRSAPRPASSGTCSRPALTSQTSPASICLSRDIGTEDFRLLVSRKNLFQTFPFVVDGNGPA